MAENEWEKAAAEKLKAYENLDAGPPSDEWKAGLLTRLRTASRTKSIGMNGRHVPILLLLFVVLNGGVLIGRFIAHTQTRPERATELRMIAQEWLINPTSLNAH